MPDEGKRTILMVDDEANVRKVGKLILEREGYHVLTASNGEEALILAKVEQPDLILLDIMMPKMDGYEMLRRLRTDQDTDEIPVIVVTAKGGEHDIATSFKFGAVFHVEKPYETGDLLQKIQVALTLKENPEPGG
jgi:CheY-like chemotaxis protein